jgi:CTP synthase (UTP-ammonia lyase)
MKVYRYETTIVAFLGATPITYIELTLAQDFETARQIILERHRHAYEVRIERAK